MHTHSRVMGTDPIRGSWQDRWGNARNQPYNYSLCVYAEWRDPPHSKMTKHLPSLSITRPLVSLGSLALASLGPRALASLGPRALASLEPQALASLGPLALASLELQALASLEPRALASLGHRALASLGPQALASLEPQALRKPRLQHDKYNNTSHLIRIMWINLVQSYQQAWLEIFEKSPGQGGPFFLWEMSSV